MNVKRQIAAHLLLNNTLFVMLLPISISTGLVWWSAWYFWQLGQYDVVNELIPPLVFCCLIGGWQISASYRAWSQLLEML